jgi:uncharacterized protein YecT (DUF1311 family)
MDINQDVAMQVCTQANGKKRNREFQGSYADCLDFAKTLAAKFAQEGWIVEHDETTCEWYLSKAGETSFEIVMGDDDTGE